MSLPPSPRRCYRAAQDSPNAWPYERGRVTPYGSRSSRRDHEQPQLFALLALRRFLRTDCRGTAALAAEWREPREALGLSRVPRYSTLAHAAPRLS